MATLEEYYAAREKRDGARAQLDAIAQKLSALAATLRDPRGVRLKEITAYAGPPPNHIMVDRDALVSWDRLAAAVRAFTQADDAFRRVEANLSPEQRRQISH